MTQLIPQTGLETALSERARMPHEWSSPLHFDLTDPNHREQLEARINSGEVQSVYDTVDIIANDLFELRNPGSKHVAEDRQQFVEDIKTQGSAFGTWVLFPWSKELVRYPDIDDHRAMRTSRNRNLITDAEQARLYEAKVAVFGLSVGSNIVERLVSSGIGGTIIMGDPDHIDPTNLNRINGSFSDVGTKKIHSMARKISEIDPYIHQVHFDQGVTVDNIDELDVHRPSLLFDEVDDFQAKAVLRQYAKANRVPLIMATDLGDRSILDVERHDLGDNKPFNGRIKPEDFTRLLAGDLDDKERGRLMIKIVGLRHVTVRMLESVMHVDNNLLPGLPQLGSTATMGASLATVAAREILLGRDLPSGRYVSSPKSLLELSPQTSVPVGLKTVAEFVKAQRAKK